MTKRKKHVYIPRKIMRLLARGYSSIHGNVNSLRVLPLYNNYDYYLPGKTVTVSISKTRQDNETITYQFKCKYIYYTTSWRDYLLLLYYKFKYYAVPCAMSPDLNIEDRMKLLEVYKFKKCMDKVYFFKIRKDDVPLVVQKVQKFRKRYFSFHFF